MSNITTNITLSPLRDRWDRFMTGFMKACEQHGRVQSRRAEIEALEAKTDEELACLGIPRDYIAYHVFRDKFYT